MVAAHFDGQRATQFEEPGQLALGEVGEIAVRQRLGQETAAFLDGEPGLPHQRLQRLQREAAAMVQMLVGRSQVGDVCGEPHYHGQTPVQRGVRHDDMQPAAGAPAWRPA